MKAEEYFALGEQALANVGETVDARDAEAFRTEAIAHFAGGICAFFLALGDPPLTDAEVQARHHPAVRLLVAALQNDGSSADDAAEDPDTLTTHEEADA